MDIMTLVALVAFGIGLALGMGLVTQMNKSSWNTRTSDFTSTLYFHNYAVTILKMLEKDLGFIDGLITDLNNPIVEEMVGQKLPEIKQRYQELVKRMPEGVHEHFMGYVTSSQMEIAESSRYFRGTYESGLTLSKEVAVLTKQLTDITNILKESKLPHRQESVS